MRGPWGQPKGPEVQSQGTEVLSVGYEGQPVRSKDQPEKSAGDVRANEQRDKKIAFIPTGQKVNKSAVNTA